MVQHLALSVERLRFRAGMAEDPNVKEVGSQGHWQVDPGLPAADVPIRMPDTSKPPTAFPLGGAPRLSQQRARPKDSNP